MMIKQGILNFFKNLKYFFTPLGTLALGLIFGLSVFIPGTASSVSALVNDVRHILSDTTIDFTALQDSVWSAVQLLDWSNPLSAVQTITSSDWLMNTLHDCVGAFVESTDVYTVQFTAAVSAFTNALAGYFVAVVFFLILGFLGGFFLTKWLVRRNIAKRSIWKYFLNCLIDSVLTAAAAALCAWLFSVWKPSILISSLVVIVLFGFIALFEAYVVHARNSVNLKDVVNGKNIFCLFAANIIIFLLSCVMTGAVTALTNEFAGLFIGIVFMEIAFIVIGLNAEAYVKNLAERQT